MQPRQNQGGWHQHQTDQQRGVSPLPYPQQGGVNPAPYPQQRGANPPPFPQQRTINPAPYPQQRGANQAPYPQLVDPTSFFAYQSRPFYVNPRSSNVPQAPTPFTPPVGSDFSFFSYEPAQALDRTHEIQQHNPYYFAQPDPSYEQMASQLAINEDLISRFARMPLTGPFTDAHDHASTQSGHRDQAEASSSQYHDDSQSNAGEDVSHDADEESSDLQGQEISNNDFIRSAGEQFKQIWLARVPEPRLYAAIDLADEVVRIEAMQGKKKTPLSSLRKHVFPEMSSRGKRNLIKRLYLVREMYEIISSKRRHGEDESLSEAQQARKKDVEEAISLLKRAREAAQTGSMDQDASMRVEEAKDSMKHRAEVAGKCLVRWLHQKGLRHIGNISKEELRLNTRRYAMEAVLPFTRSRQPIFSGRGDFLRSMIRYLTEMKQGWDLRMESNLDDLAYLLENNRFVSN